MKKLNFPSSIKNKNLPLISFSNKKFSIIHNYHSPYIVWSSGTNCIFDDNINEYNEYIQAFLEKRFTHKKEIWAKIKVLKDLDKILKDYHNTFYVQITYPVHNLIPYAYMKHIHSHNIIDSGYVISRFFEEWEKPMYDAAFSKFFVCGRVEFMEDAEYFKKLKTDVNKLIDIFYNGDKLSEFEREIERAYLTVKQNKFNELQAKYFANPKLKRDECFLTFSEKNKIFGHVNFRMRHPSYFFQPRPIFEKISVDKMFYSLYEIRYNVLKKFQLYKKLQLKFYYRKSLLNSPHRVEYASYYLYLQVFQYLECYEFYNEFNLKLNFKQNFNMMVLHFWLIIQRLQKIAEDKNCDKLTKKFCSQIIYNLKERIVNYFMGNLDKLQFTHRESPKISNVHIFVNKLLDLYTWHFEIINHGENKLPLLRNLINDIVFENSGKSIDDKYLMKFVYYISIHYDYLNNKSYKDIESSDFDFSVMRIPNNYSCVNYVKNLDELSLLFKKYEEFYKSTTAEVKSKEFLENYENNKKFLFNKLKIKGKSSDDFSLFKKVANVFGINPYKDAKNFFEVDIEKGWRGKFYKFMKNEMFYENAIAIEKVGS
jgi:hypothetical protein